MGYPISIDIAKIANGSNKSKGDLLESLASIIFEKLGYEVVREIRRTGMEVDIHAKRKIGGRKVLIECKAWDDNLPAEIISKTVGNAMIGNYDESILISTGPLTKDALGIIATKDENQALKGFTLLQANDIISILIDCSVIKRHETLNISEIPNILDFTLLITDSSYYWLVKLFPSNTNLATTIIVFDAKTGDEITNNDLLKNIYNTDNNCKDYEWKIRDSLVLNDTKIEEELNNIIPVVCGDDWFDTRPAAPNDFIGRKSPVSKIIKFYKEVIDEQAQTRIFSITSPSGMGKSSMIIKINSESQKKFSEKIFNYSVDVRSAASLRYIEVVLLKLFKQMSENAFIDFDCSKLFFSNVNDFFNSVEVVKALKQIKKQKKLIVLIFDQFEEIFAKEEFGKIFHTAKQLCFILESLKTNFIIGFAWKTDFNLPSAHPAYQIWSELRDHRIEYEISRFNDKECKECMQKFIFNSKRNIKDKLILQKFLIEQSNGLPWLLKKLCIHLENTYENVDDQLEIISEGLQREKIFEQDLIGLSEDDNNCLKAIARYSPADYFEMLENYRESVGKLINRRLVIKRGNKLVLYWDIFKDYIINNISPDYDFEMLPTSQFSTFYKAMEIVSYKGSVSVSELAKELLIKESSAFNIIVDFTRFDLITRKNDSISLKEKDLNSNIKKVANIFLKHCIYKKIKNPSDISYDDFANIFSEKYNYIGKTRLSYIAKLLGWFEGISIIKRNNIKRNKKGKARLREGLYYVEATCKNVEALLKSINGGQRTFSSYQDRKKKNSLLFVWKIGAIQVEHDIIINNCTMQDIIEKIKELDIYKSCCDYLRENKNKYVEELGRYLENKFFDNNITSTTARRYANWMHSWYIIIQKKEIPTLFDYIE